MIAMPRNQDIMERLVEKNRDIPNLGINNSVPYHEWPRFLQKAKLLVNTSRFEGYPYTFSLAMASSVPVASLHVNPDQILTKKDAGLCADGSELRLVQDVSDLVTYSNQRKRYHDNALALAENEYSFKKTGPVYHQLFLKASSKNK